MAPVRSSAELRRASDAADPTPSASDAEKAGLEYVNDGEPGIRRQKRGTGFTYLLDSSGKTVRDPYAMARIRSLAIPPAWTDVWICASEHGHLQATGRDAKGRKQYRYHVDFIAVRDSAKYERLVEFAKALPAVRESIDEQMALPGLPREKVLATIVHLLDSTLIRVGNDAYARDNASYGITTLRNSHVKVEGGELRFQFKGKSGKSWRVTVRDRRVAKIIRSCQELPGQHLFRYLDEDGNALRITSTDVNDYLRDTDRVRDHGQGFPHLGRHRAGGEPAAGDRKARQRDRRQAPDPRGIASGGGAARQHGRDLPQVLRPSQRAGSFHGGHAAPAPPRGQRQRVAPGRSGDAALPAAREPSPAPPAAGWDWRAPVPSPWPPDRPRHRPADDRTRGARRCRSRSAAAPCPAGNRCGRD